MLMGTKVGWYLDLHKLIPSEKVLYERYRLYKIIYLRNIFVMKQKEVVCGTQNKIGLSSTRPIYE